MKDWIALGSTPGYYLRYGDVALSVPLLPGHPIVEECAGDGASRCDGLRVNVSRCASHGPRAGLSD